MSGIIAPEHKIIASIMAGINYEYLSLMGIQIWIPQHLSSITNQLEHIEVFRLQKNEAVGLLFVQKSSTQQKFSDKERHLLEGFLFALDLQYNKAEFSQVIADSELASAKLIILLGSMPEILNTTCNQQSLKIKGESLQNFILNPLKKSFFWKELQKAFRLFEEF